MEISRIIFFDVSRAVFWGIYSINQRRLYKGGGKIMEEYKFTDFAHEDGFELNTYLTYLFEQASTGGSEPNLQAINE
ncbi:hypothetical protein D0466_04830 [Peribacillus glennii]|uniref:Uncharacterized protein n=1 Tax=Peribacillus glennii TaxID=2303991 RepID=A0A372LG07_9BACI|nr:hypothetical protein D0466_04830 [Peribacillus glennii]